MVICWIDCDITGTASISHLVKSGHVLHYPAPDLPAAEQIVAWLNEGRIRCDMVVLDTATALADQTLRDLVVDPSKAKSGWQPQWGARKSNKASWDEYGSNARLLANLFHGLRRLPIPNVIVSHESERDDPLGSGRELIAPGLQSKINSNLYTYADGILRLYQAQTPFQWGNATVPQNTRILQLARTADTACGLRVTPDRPVPPILVDPTFPMLVETIGYLPKSLVVYGPPKVGKTTFVASAVYLTPGAQ